MNFESKSFCQYLWLEGSQMYDSRIEVVTVQREGRCPSSLATVRNSTASLVLMQRAAHTQTAAPSARETERALSLIRTPRAQQGLCHFTYRAPEITPLLMLKIKISFHWRMWRLERCFVFTFFYLIVIFPLGAPGKRSLAFSKLDRLIDRNWFKESVTLTHSCLRCCRSYRQIHVDRKQEVDSLFHMIRVVPQVEN